MEILIVCAVLGAGYLGLRSWGNGQMKVADKQIEQGHVGAGIMTGAVAILLMLALVVVALIAFVAMQEGVLR
jgi:hypothetical protein